MECTCVQCPVHQGGYGSATAAVYRAVEDGRLWIDNDGQVWRVLNDGLRRAECVKGPYLRISLRVASKVRNTYAHRLVWHHFNGPIPAGLQVNHINGVHTDNRPDNLELLNASQQAYHRYYVLGQHNLSAKGRKKGGETMKRMPR